MFTLLHLEHMPTCSNEQSPIVVHIDASNYVFLSFLFLLGNLNRPNKQSETQK